MNTPAQDPSGALVPVFSGLIAGQPTQLCNARELHAFLRVGRDFSNWIKQRLEDGGFILNQDYISLENLTSPNLARSKSRARLAIDYHLTLETAKHISMMERNERGRAVRQYFIDCERGVSAPLPPPLPRPSPDAPPPPPWLEHPPEHFRVLTTYEDGVLIDRRILKDDEHCMSLDSFMDVAVQAGAALRREDVLRRANDADNLAKEAQAIAVRLRHALQR